MQQVQRPVDRGKRLCRRNENLNHNCQLKSKIIVNCERVRLQFQAVNWWVYEALTVTNRHRLFYAAKVNAIGLIDEKIVSINEAGWVSHAKSLLNARETFTLHCRNQDCEHFQSYFYLEQIDNQRDRSRWWWRVQRLPVRSMNQPTSEWRSQPKPSARQLLLNILSITSIDKRQTLC